MLLIERRIVNMSNIEKDIAKPEMKKLLFIINPRSGTMQAAKLLAEIIQIFSDAGYLTTVLMTKASGDAKQFVIDYHDMADTIVCSGGDGTLNEVIDGLISCGGKCKVGYIPSGSTNDFAASMGLPKGVLAAAEHFVNGSDKNIDIGSFNGRSFSYVASFGAFTSTSYKVPQNIKNILGHTAYILQGAKDIVGIKPIHAKIFADEGTPNEQVCEGDYIFGAICNSTSVAGILKLDKFDVDMNDGLMEILLVKMPKNLVGINEIIVDMMNGTLRSSEIEFFSARDVRVEIEEGTHWSLDGEYEEGADEVFIKTLRSAITMLV